MTMLKVLEMEKMADGIKIDKREPKMDLGKIEEDGTMTETMSKEVQTTMEALVRGFNNKVKLEKEGETLEEIEEAILEEIEGGTSVKGMVMGMSQGLKKEESSGDLEMIRTTPWKITKTIQNGSQIA